MNLFVSVVIDNFKQMKEELGGYLLLSKDQRDWVEMQKFMQRKKLKIKIPIPQNRWRKFCHQIVTSSSFEIFFLVCILINVIIMACRYLEMPPNLDYFLLVANDFILILFNIECILKIMAFGLFLFKDFWDKFDFVVISASDIIVISLMAIEKQEITTIPTILRIMRLFRIVKMIKVSKTFQVIINTYYNILPSLGNIGALIFLILYIYAILGMNLFSTIEIRPYKSGIQPQWIPDFTQFSGSLLTMIQCAMLQKWDHYMFELAEVKEGCSYTQSYEDIQISGIKGCGTPWSYVYFLSFIIIVPLTVMNLFLAVVVEGYLESLKEQEAVINPCQMEELLDKWAEYDPEGTGFMTPENMAFLLYELNPPIGLKDDSVQFEYDIRSKKNKGYLISANKKVILTKHQIFDLMKRYNPKLYNENKVHFKDLFVKISQNVIMKLSGKKEYTFESNQTINHNLEIKSDYVVKTLNKGWYSVYPDLKKQRLESIKNNRRDLKASDLFAIHSIMTLLRKAKAEKKNKPSNNEVDYRIYHEYQQTNLLDKSLANKVLRTQTALTQAPIYKKRASRYSSPYKSRQTMISHSEKSNKSNVENEYQKKTTYAANLNFTANIKSAELRKTSTVDYEPNSHSEFKQDDKKKIKIQERVLHVGLKLINRLPDEKFRLKSVQEIEEDDKLFWFSYDEDFGQYPNKIKEDVQSLGSFKPKTQEVRINSLDEKIKEILSNEEEKSSMTEDLFNESDRKSNQSQNSIKNVKTKIGMNSIKKPIEIQMSNNDGKETFQIKIMPLKLLKTKK